MVGKIVYFSATGGGGTFGLDTHNGKVRWRRRAGIYTPVVATAQAFYFVTYRTITRLVRKPGSAKPAATARP